MLAIPTLGWWRQEDLQELKASLGYMRPCLDHSIKWKWPCCESVAAFSHPMNQELIVHTAFPDHEAQAPAALGQVQPCQYPPRQANMHGGFGRRVWHFEWCEVGWVSFSGPGLKAFLQGDATEWQQNFRVCGLVTWHSGSTWAAWEAATCQSQTRSTSFL